MSPIFFGGDESGKAKTKLHLKDVDVSTQQSHFVKGCQHKKFDVGSRELYKNL